MKKIKNINVTNDTNDTNGTNGTNGTKPKGTGDLRTDTARLTVPIPLPPNSSLTSLASLRSTQPPTPSLSPSPPPMIAEKDTSQLRRTMSMPATIHVRKRHVVSLLPRTISEGVIPEPLLGVVHL